MFRKWGWKSFSIRDLGQQESPVLEGGLASHGRAPCPASLIPHVPVPEAPGRPPCPPEVRGWERSRVGPPCFIMKHVKRTEELKGSPSIEAVSSCPQHCQLHVLACVCR